MRKTFYAVLRSMLGIGNVYPTIRTAPGQLAGFMRSMAPMKTDLPLIRLGPKTDGGYLVPDDLQGIAACFSPGVSLESGFELDCANRGMEVFMADKSVQGPAAQHPRFHFLPKFLGITVDQDFLTLESWVASSLPGSREDLLLQMDIEGYEYEVLLDAHASLLNRFRIIACEVHNIDRFWSEPYFKLAARALTKLSQTHTCVHIHPNNESKAIQIGSLVTPRALEFTFLRNDRVRNPVPATVFPHPLDYENTQRTPQVLPACWRR